MDSTPIFGLGIPSADGSDGADLAALLRTLGLDVENKAGGITAMTSAARAALTGAGKYEGRVVHETDTDTLWRSDGTNWRQLALLDSSGHLPMGGKKVTGLANGSSAQDAATKGQVDAASSAASAAQSTANAALPKSGGAMTGQINMGSDKIVGLLPGTSSTDAATKGQVDAASSVANAALPKAGGTMTGTLIVDRSSGYSNVILKNADAAFWISTDPGASNALTIAVLDKTTLAYVATAMSVNPTTGEVTFPNGIRVPIAGIDYY